MRRHKNPLQAKALASGGHSAPAGFENRAGRYAPRAQSRDETEKNSGENRQARSKTEYPPVRTHVEEDGVIRRGDKRDQEAAENSGKQAAAHGSNNGE